MLGMHRSGTSATAGVLRLLGFDLGQHLLDPAEDNVAGYWENASVVQANEALLAAAGRTWDDFRYFGRSELLQSAKKTGVDFISIVTQEFGKNRLVAVKDPRMCLTYEVWRKAFTARAYAVSVLVVCRHPDAVVRSLEKRDHMPPVIGYTLYIRYSLEAVSAAMSADSYAALDYTDVLSDWRSVFRDVLGKLDLVEIMGDVSNHSPIDRFVDANMSHSGEVASETEDDDVQGLRTIAISAYEMARECEKWSRAALDDLISRFERCLLGQSPSNAARFDTHLRWCARHEESVKGFRDMLRGNVDQLHRVEVGLQEAGSLALERLARIEEQQKQLEKLEISEVLLKQGRLELDAANTARDDCQSRLTELEAGLKLASRLSIERLGLLEAEGRRIARLESRVEELSVEATSNLELAEAKDLECRRLTEALECVTRLCNDRLEQIHEQESTLQSYDESLNSVTQQALDRLAEMEQLSKRLQNEQATLAATQEAFEVASGLAIERLQLLSKQDEHVGALENRIEELSVAATSNLELAEAKDLESRRLTEALERVTRLCNDRLEQINDQESSLKMYHDKLNATVQRSTEKVATLEKRLHRLDQEKLVLESDRDAALAKVGRLSENYERLVDEHERTKRSVKRLHDKALRFASQAIEARRSLIARLRLRNARRKGS
ncbi:MAG TPA: hypothetical protein VN039_15180 [Nitrospira sp.]|nr:hypothetical protein [Nitrospira sp.]